MTNDLDPYLVLGVAHAAGPEEITRAYRQQVRRHHPDTAPAELTEAAAAEARAALAEVQGAYDLLRDPAARAEYDRRHPLDPAPAAAAERHRRTRPSVSVLPDPDPDERLPLWAGPVYWWPHRR